MSFSFSVNSLSALVPANFSYNYNTEEALAYTPQVFSNQFYYNRYSALENLQDAAISKKNILFLTNPIPLSGIFEPTLKTNKVGDIAGTMFLQTLSGNLFQYTGDTVFVGPSNYNKLILTITNIDSNTVELNTNEGSYLVVDEQYPYTVRTSTAPLAPGQEYRKYFTIDYSNGLMSIKTNTAQGSRYLSFGVDGILRGVGLTLNNTIINNNLVVPTFITPAQLSLGFNTAASEVQYYNSLESFTYKTTLDIQNVYVSDTNLLISCAASDIAKSNNAKINIAMLRTNYTSTGSYAPSPTNSSVNTLLSTSNYYLTEEDGITPIFIEDYINVGSNNHRDFLLNI